MLDLETPSLLGGGWYAATVMAVNTTNVQNVSSVPGATCTDALNQLQTDIAANTTAIADLNSDDIANNSSVSGGSVSGALNVLMLAVADKADANINFVDEAGTSITITSSHANKVIRCSSNSPITVTANALASGQSVGIMQNGSGQITVTSGTCTVRKGGSFNAKSLEQNTMIVLTYDSANTALLGGQLEPV